MNLTTSSDTSNQSRLVDTKRKNMKTFQPGESDHGAVLESSTDGAFTIRWTEKVVLACLMLMGFYTSGEAIGISIPLAEISSDLHSSTVQAIWIGSSYFVASSVAQPIFASFSHIFGRKGPTLASIGLFMIGSLLCSLSKNITVMLTGRVIQGLGSGGITALTEVLITDIIPLRQRGTYFGLISLSWAFGSALGPVIGASFAQRTTWRWLFWFILPLSGITFVLIAWTLRLKEKRSHILMKIKEVDWVGAVIFLASCTALLVAISWGGIEFSWSSAATLVPLLVGGLGLGLFVVWEIYCPVQPLVPLSIFSSRSGAAGYIQITVNGCLLWTLVYYLPLYFEVVKGYSQIVTSVSVFPETLLVAPIAVVIGIMIRKTGKYRKLLWAGWIFNTLGAGLMINLKANSTIPQWIFINMVGGLGMGILLPTMQTSVQAAASDQDMAFAAAMVATLRTLGQAIALPIYGAIFQSVLKKHLENTPLQAQATTLSRDAFQAILAIKEVQFGPENTLILVQAFQQALRFCFVGMVPAAGIGLIASFFTQELTLDRDLSTEHGIDDSKAWPDKESGESSD